MMELLVGFSVDDFNDKKVEVFWVMVLLDFDWCVCGQYFGYIEVVGVVSDLVIEMYVVL